MTDIPIFYILLPFAFMTGTAIGSFVTMASYRLPLGEEIVFAPSHCPKCNAKLSAKDLFPLFSWVLARGRCRYCGASVSVRYPVIEVALGCTFMALVLFYGLTFKTFLLSLLVTQLAILIVTDLEHTIIPDGVQVALFITGLAWCIRNNTEWRDVIASASLGLGLGLLLHYGYKWVRKKDGLGWADVKFLCVAGVWLPFFSFVPFLFFSGVLGTLTGLFWRALKKGPIFPFGPALAVSLLINVLFPDLLSRLN